METTAATPVNAVLGKQTMGFSHVLSNADAVTWFVLIALVLGSVLSWYLIVNKSIALLRMRKRAEQFLDQFWAAPNSDAVRVLVNESAAHNPYAHLVQHGYAALHHVEILNQSSEEGEATTADDVLVRALRRSIEEDKRKLEFGQTFLATVASSAPFLGLLGTVWGIYHALTAIAMTGKSSLENVAGPIGEALIMTAIGLAVAIPAAIAYNAFSRSTRNTMGLLNSFAYDVHNFLRIGVKTSMKVAIPHKPQTAQQSMLKTHMPEAA